METTLEVVHAVQRIDGLKLMAVPDMTCVSFTTESSLNIHAVADAMEKKGWKMERCVYGCICVFECLFFYVCVPALLVCLLAVSHTAWIDSAMMQSLLTTHSQPTLLIIYARDE
jgi:hypothetical protein